MRLIALAALLLAFAAAPGRAQEQRIEPVGVPECDNLIARWNACRAKKPVGERTAMDGQITQLRTGWVQLMPNRRPMVAQSCTQATQMLLDGSDC